MGVIQSVAAPFRRLLYDDQLYTACMAVRSVGDAFAAASKHAMPLLIVVGLSMLYLTIALVGVPVVFTKIGCGSRAAVASLTRRNRNNKAASKSTRPIFIALTVVTVIAGLVFVDLTINNQARFGIRNIRSTTATAIGELVSLQDRAHSVVADVAAVLAPSGMAMNAIMDNSGSSGVDLRPFARQSQNLIKTSSDTRTYLNQRMTEARAKFPTILGMISINDIEKQLNSFNSLGKFDDLQSQLAMISQPALSSSPAAGSSTPTPKSAAKYIPPEYDQALTVFEKVELSRYIITMIILVLTLVVASVGLLGFPKKWSRVMAIMAAILVLLLVFMWGLHIIHILMASVLGSTCDSMKISVFYEYLTPKQIYEISHSCATKNDLLVAFYDGMNLVHKDFSPYSTVNFRPSKKQIDITINGSVMAISMTDSDPYVKAIGAIASEKAQKAQKELAAGIEGAKGTLESISSDLDGIDFDDLTAKASNGVAQMIALKSDAETVKPFSSAAASYLLETANTGAEKFNKIIEELDSLKAKTPKAKKDIAGLITYVEGMNDAKIKALSDTLQDTAKNFAKNTLPAMLECKQFGISVSTFIDELCLTGMFALDGLHGGMALLAVLSVVMIILIFMLVARMPEPYVSEDNIEMVKLGAPAAAEDAEMSIAHKVAAEDDRSE